MLPGVSGIEHRFPLDIQPTTEVRQAHLRPVTHHEPLYDIVALHQREELLRADQSNIKPELPFPTPIYTNRALLLGYYPVIIGHVWGIDIRV